MASLVHQAPAAAAAAGMVQCDDEFVVPQRFGCFGRSMSRASSGRRLEYCRVLSEGEERRVAQQERSARARLRWRAVAQEIIARRGGGGGARRRSKQAPAAAAFSYDSKSYALNFDQGEGAEL